MWASERCASWPGKLDELAGRLRDPLASDTSSRAVSYKIPLSAGGCSECKETKWFKYSQWHVRPRRGNVQCETRTEPADSGNSREASHLPTSSSRAVMKPVMERVRTQALARTPQSRMAELGCSRALHTRDSARRRFPKSPKSSCLAASEGPSASGDSRVVRRARCR